MPKQPRPLTVGEARAIHDRLVNLTPAERAKMRQIKQQAQVELVAEYNAHVQMMTLLSKLADEQMRSYQEGE